MAQPAFGALDAGGHIAKAIELIRQQQYAFARVWLDPAVVAYHLHPQQRSHAYYLRGRCFQAQELNVSAAQDYARAVDFNPANPAALYALAGLHATGLGVSRDQALAFALYQKAAELGHAGAQSYAGYAYLAGAGVAQDLLQARPWLARAAEQGQAAAMVQLAASYRAAYTDAPDSALAKHWYERAARAGAVEAFVALGYMARNGEFGVPSPQAAAAYFKQAAEAGSGPGMANLAYAHLSGQGVPQNYVFARVLFQRAAQLGAAGGYVGLGHIYEAGLGVAPDEGVAMAWYRQGAEAGLRQPTVRLVRLLIVQGEVAAASRWLENLLAIGDAKSLNSYAWLRATSKAAGLRNGRLALAQAQRAVAMDPNPSYLDTLAAAYAELGRFDDATATQRQALALAAGSGPLIDELNVHLAAYQRAQPWRE